MQTMQAILTRRSVRRFIPDKPIPRELLTEVIKAGQYAPSAKNCQPWEFVVVEDKEFLANLAQYQPWTAFAKGAAAVLFVLGDTNQAMHDEAEGWDLADIDCSLAAQNILLAAHDLGLGATICAASPVPGIIERLSGLLKLPKHLRPVAIIVMGYPEGEVKQPEKRFDPAKIHWGKY